MLLAEVRGVKQTGHITIQNEFKDFKNGLDLYERDINTSCQLTLMNGYQKGNEGKCLISNPGSNVSAECITIVIRFSTLWPRMVVSMTITAFMT